MIRNVSFGILNFEILLRRDEARDRTYHNSRADNYRENEREIRDVVREDIDADEEIRGEAAEIISDWVENAESQ